MLIDRVFKQKSEFWPLVVARLINEVFSFLGKKKSDKISPTVCLSSSSIKLYQIFCVVIDCFEKYNTQDFPNSRSAEIGQKICKDLVFVHFLGLSRVVAPPALKSTFRCLQELLRCGFLNYELRFDTVIRNFALRWRSIGINTEQ